MGEQLPKEILGRLEGANLKFTDITRLLGQGMDNPFFDVKKYFESDAFLKKLNDPNGRNLERLQTLEILTKKYIHNTDEESKRILRMIDEARLFVEHELQPGDLEIPRKFKDLKSRKKVPKKEWDNYFYSIEEHLKKLAMFHTKFQRLRDLDSSLEVNLMPPRKKVEVNGITILDNARTVLYGGIGRDFEVGSEYWQIVFECIKETDAHGKPREEIGNADVDELLQMLNAKAIERGRNPRLRDDIHKLNNKINAKWKPIGIKILRIDEVLNQVILEPREADSH